MATLRELLKEKHLTQPALAESTGLAISSISRAVCGYPIQKSTLSLLSHALGVSARDIEGVNLYVPAAKRKKMGM